MAVHFVVNSDNKKLKEAAKICPMFFRQMDLADFPIGFTHTELTAPEVHLTIIDGAVCLPDKYVIVETYRPKWPWSKVIGYTLPSKPNYIFVNHYGLSKFDTHDYVGNFTHEFMHILGFKHKGNYPNKYHNDLSVPYAIGAMAEAWARSLEEKENNQMSMGV